MQKPYVVIKGERIDTINIILSNMVLFLILDKPLVLLFMYCFMLHSVPTTWLWSKWSISPYMWILRYRVFSFFQSKLSPNFPVKAIKDILKICGKWVTDVCVYADKLN